MTLFTAVHHLPGSMRSLAISKLPQSTNVCGGKKKKTGIGKKNHQSQNYEANKTLPSSCYFAI